MLSNNVTSGVSATFAAGNGVPNAAAAFVLGSVPLAVPLPGGCSLLNDALIGWTGNRRWSRRLLSRRAVVLLITDGLDAEAGEGVEAAMERLALSCKRLVWLNPLLRFEGFEPRAAGIRAMLPHVDDLLPVHDLHSLAGLAEALSGAPQRSARARA